MLTSTSMSQEDSRTGTLRCYGAVVRRDSGQPVPAVAEKKTRLGNADNACMYTSSDYWGSGCGPPAPQMITLGLVCEMIPRYYETYLCSPPTSIST